jgi:transposase
MRFIGLDVHRDFCEVAISEGGKARRVSRVAARPAELELFAQSLGPDDRVELEATGNALAIARIIERHVGEVVLAHSRRVRAIAEAKVKTDAIDACTLAELLAADLVPRVWLGDERTRLLRRLVSRRRQLVKQSTRTKNEISAVLLRTLQGRPPVSDVFGRRGGRGWWRSSSASTSGRRSMLACGSSTSCWLSSFTLTGRSLSRRSGRLRSGG